MSGWASPARKTSRRSKAITMRMQTMRPSATNQKSRQYFEQRLAMLSAEAK